MINFLVQSIVNLIDKIGYLGIFTLMVLESCGIPLPSEATMPFSGFLVADGKLNFWAVVLIGTVANLIGSWIAYFIGLKGGRLLIEKYGKYFLISHHDLNIADKWFSKHGEWIVFLGRLLPVIRTYISFPAGIAKMNFKKFSLYTFLGALPWSILFTWLGVKLGKNWEQIRSQLHNFDIVIIILIIFLIILYIWWHLRHSKKRLHEYN